MNRPHPFVVLALAAPLTVFGCGQEADDQDHQNRMGKAMREDRDHGSGRVRATRCPSP